MSSGTRAQRMGTKAVLPSTGKHNKQTDKHSDTPKGQDKIQPTADQMRIAQIMELHLDEPGIRTKVSAMMEMTCRSEDEVCSALHDCDYDMDRAVNSLFENIKPQNEWEMQVKKKKNRVSSTGGGGSIVAEVEEDWDSPSGQTGSGTGTSTSAHTEPQRGSRGRGGVPGGRGLRRGNVDNRGWRGRENNERNTDDGNDRGYRGDRGDGGYRRGGSRSLNGPGGRGGGFGGRGGRGGGRLGQRSYQSRSDNHRGPLRQREENTVSWDDPEPSSNTDSTYNKEENWDETFPSPEDWDNEEYTGSLADTKVFEPSGKSDHPDDSQEPESQDQNDDGIQQYSAIVTSSNYVDQQHMASPDNTISGFVSPNSSGALQGTADQCSSVAQLPEVHSAPTAAQQLTQALELHANATQNTSSLSAEQSQYFSTLAQQSITASASTIPYSNVSGGTYLSQGYNIGTTYTTMADSVVSTQQPQRKQRARVPPPSKIPATAVEMPADVSSNIGYLDVQFGALEFGSDTSSFDGSVEAKYEAPTTQSSSDLSAQQLDGYKTANNISTSMGQGQIIASTDSLVHTSENNLSSVSVQNYPSQSRVGISVPASIQSVASSNSTLEQQLSKSEQHSYGPSSAVPTLHQAAYQQNSYSTKAQNAYQSPTPYTNNYSSQVTTTSYPPQSVNSYSNNSSYNSTANAYHPSSNVGNSTYVAGAAVQGYQGAFTSSIVQQAAANVYPVQNQNSYQSAVTNSAVYGSGTGLNSYSVSNANSNAGSIQYNNYTVGVATTHSLKQPATKDIQSQYDPSQANNTSTTGSSVSSPASLSNLNTQPASSTTKVTSNSANASKSASIVNNSAVASNSASNMAGVAPVMGAQYIMGQAGVPFYQQPLYSYEDLQLLQQRIPHMQTGYYDMSYQTPTTLSTSRDGSIGSVQYSLSDGRYARADNASPVPSTMSQQTGSQGHAGAPMLNPALPPGYAYFAYGGGMMPGSFQYGTPAIYPQMATTANAHGSTTTNQYPKPSYSGYSSGYDSLSQSQGDYNKGGYPAGAGGAQPQGAKPSAGTNSAPVQSSNNDMTSGMYTKSHAALNKVNSYEKQGFHSGTPPPFSLVGSGGSGLAPYTPHLFVPTMQPPHQQHHSTPLLHQPLHQDSGNRLLQDTGSSSGQRSQSTSQPKSGAKQGYSSSPYWTPN